MATYYLAYELTKVTVQTSSGGGTPTIVSTLLEKPQGVTPSIDSKTYEWEGGATLEKIESLASVAYEIDLACIPASAHAAIFTKTAVTGAALPAGMTAAYGYGGGKDASGVPAGLVLEGFATKDVDGARSTVTLMIWLPKGTLSLRQPPGLTSGDVAEPVGYLFNATKTTTNIIGTALTGVSSDGEFYIIGEK